MRLNFENPQSEKEAQIVHSLEICLGILGFGDEKTGTANGVHYYKNIDDEGLFNRTVRAIPRENGLDESERTALELSIDPEQRLRFTLFNHTELLAQIEFTENGVVAYRPSLRGGYQIWEEKGQLKRSWAGEEIGPVTQMDHQFWNEIVQPIREIVINRIEEKSEPRDR